MSLFVENTATDAIDRAIAYQFTIGAVGFAIGAEIASPPLRAKVQAIVGLSQGVV